MEHYNDVRLNSAIGYITPKDMLAGRQQEIHAERDRKVEEARKQRRCDAITCRVTSAAGLTPCCQPAAKTSGNCSTG